MVSDQHKLTTPVKEREPSGVSEQPSAVPNHAVVPDLVSADRFLVPDRHFVALEHPDQHSVIPDRHSKSGTPVTVRLALVAMFTAWLAVTLAHTPLMYDGSSYLMSILSAEQPNPVFFRYALVLFHSPTIWVAQLTDQLEPAVLVFSALFSSGPLVASWLSWRIVRDYKPTLFVWSMFAIALTGIYAQIYRIGENLYACELVWPLLLGVLVPVNGRRAVLLVALGLLLANLHPIAVSLLVGVAITACLQAFTKFRKDPVGAKQEATILLRIASALFLIAAIRLSMAALWSDDYEVKELRPERIHEHFAAVNQILLPFFVGTGLLSGIYLLIATFAKNKFICRTFCVLALFGTLISGTYAIWWSSYIDHWMQSWSYLRFLFLLLVPLMGCAVIDSFKSSKMTLFRSSLALICALFFCSTACIQAFMLHHATGKVKATIEASPTEVIDLNDCRWASRAPFAHWSTPCYAVVVQGRNPEKVVLLHRFVETARKTGAITLVPWAPPFQNGFFKLPDTRESVPPKLESLK